MTDDERQFLKRLQAGDHPDWAKLAEVMMPMIRGKLKYLTDDGEKLEDVTNELMVGFVANIRKVAIDPAPPPESSTF